MAVVIERVTSVLLADGWHVVTWDKLADGRRVSTFAHELSFGLELGNGQTIALVPASSLPGAFRFRGFPEHDSTRTMTVYEGPIANVLAYRYLTEEDAEARRKREDEYDARRSGG